MTKKRKGHMTLEEHHAQLKAEGKWEDYVSRKESRDTALKTRADEYAQAEFPLLLELRAAGAQISSVWDLVNSKRPYPQLVPILFSHLDRSYPERVREGIVRALAVPEARPLWDQLVNRYIAESDKTASGMKWLLHLVIAAAADISVLDSLILLATDPRHGRNRAMFIDALARIGGPRAHRILDDLTMDVDLADDVRRVLRKPTPRKKR